MANRLTKGTALVGGVRIGAGELLKKIRYYQPSLSPALVAANTTAEQSFTVTGLAVGDIVLAVNKPAAQAGLGLVGARVAAANTLALTFSNNTAAGITPTAAETYKVVVLTA